MDYAIIVAGGKGERMGAALPKQFMELCGRPVLMHAIDRFKAYDPGLHVILVLPAEYRPLWEGLCRRHGFATEVEVVDGGPTRFHSSQNGVAAIPAGAHGVAAIHDGARPLPPPGMIARCYETAAEEFAAVPTLPVADTLRVRTPGGGSRTADRSAFRAAQTPQVFDIQLLKRAFAQPYDPAFTDDASVVEALGCGVAEVEGDRRNIKLTTPEDFAVAEALLKMG